MKKLDIFEMLYEGTFITDKNGRTTYVANDVDSNSVRSDSNIKAATSSQGQKLKETELEEMARIPSKYKLTDDWQEKFNELPPKAQKNKTVNFIINFAKENEEWQILDIAKAYGELKGDPKFARQQMFNPVVKDVLETYGIVEPTSGDALTKPRKSLRKDAEDDDLEDPEQKADDELSQYFNISKMKKDDDEEIEPEIEPDLPKQSYIAPTSARAKAAEFFFNNDRLLQKLINLQSQSRTKIKRNLSEIEMRDDKFYDQEKNRISSSISKLDELIQEYIDLIRQEDPEVQEAIIDMLDGKLSNYRNLYNKIVKLLGEIPKFEPSKEENFDDIDLSNLEFDEEDLDEPLDEWVIKQFKIRAGIIK